MLNFLKGTKTRLTLTLNRSNGIYVPGETIGMTIEIRPHKDLKLRGAQVRLRGMEHYQYRTVTHSIKEGQSQEEIDYHWGKHEFFAATQDFLSETTLSSGSHQRYSCQMRLPVDALPSCAGRIMRIQWQVSVKLRRRMARNWHADADLSVLSLFPGTEVPTSEYGESNKPNQARLALMLPGLEAVAGQELNGQLCILPHKDFTSAVRVELVCIETVSYDEGGRSKKNFPLKLADKTQFIAGQEQTIPFQISIPQDGLPSIEAPHGSIIWTIKGILDRRLRRDIVVAQDFMVHPARM